MKHVLLDMITSERAEFIKQIGSPAEVIEKLERYAALLNEWSERFNLVAASTLPHIWSRHFLDSAQLFRFIPDTARVIADIGSGAGFPGLVLSIMGIKKVHLIDGTGKKANFLRAVVDDLKLDAIVHQERAENMGDLKADVITARALAPLPELLGFSNALIRKGTICLYLKGQNVDAELTESAKYWTFSHEKFASISDPSGSVLILKDVKIHYAAARKKSNNNKSKNHAK